MGLRAGSFEAIDFPSVLLLQGSSSRGDIKEGAQQATCWFSFALFLFSCTPLIVYQPDPTRKMHRLTEKISYLLFTLFDGVLGH